MQATRRGFILAATAAAVLPMPRHPAYAGESVFERIVKPKAAQLAQQPMSRDAPLPQPLKDLDYDHFRMINFRAERALWRDHGLFQVQLFHRGFQYDRKVTINTVENGTVAEVAY